MKQAVKEVVEVLSLPSPAQNVTKTETPLPTQAPTEEVVSLSHPQTQPQQPQEKENRRLSKSFSAILGLGDGNLIYL